MPNKNPEQVLTTSGMPLKSAAPPVAPGQLMSAKEFAGAAEVSDSMYPAAIRPAAERVQMSPEALGGGTDEGPSKQSLRSISRVETAVASIAALLAVVTILWRDWVERVLGVNPDHHSGSIEREWVVALLLAAMLLATMARRAWHRASLAASVENRPSESSAIG